MTRYKLQVWIESNANFEPNDTQALLSGARMMENDFNGKVVKSKINAQKPKPVYIPKRKPKEAESTPA